MLADYKGVSVADAAVVIGEHGLDDEATEDATIVSGLALMWSKPLVLVAGVPATDADDWNPLDEWPKVGVKHYLFPMGSKKQTTPRARPTNGHKNDQPRARSPEHPVGPELVFETFQVGHVWAKFHHSQLFRKYKVCVKQLSVH